MSHRTSDRVLISLSSADVGVIEHALTALGSGDAQRCLASLRAALDRGVVLDREEVVDAWADGASVQVRAITVHGDPVDMGSDEARAHARQILAAADEADAG